jgi:hypothetical protein
VADVIQQFVEVNATAFSKILKKVRNIVDLLSTHADGYTVGQDIKGCLFLCMDVATLADQHASLEKSSSTYHERLKYNPVSIVTLSVICRIKRPKPFSTFLGGLKAREYKFHKR